jgi:hypothetical protein
VPCESGGTLWTDQLPKTGKKVIGHPEEVVTIDADSVPAFVLNTEAATVDNYMAGEEICPKYPSMLKAYCSHCQGSERGTADNPRFSLKENYFNDYPIVEVLKNGGSVHLWDSNFRFGVRKAQMLISCVALLREFWRSTDDERRMFKPKLIEDQRRGLRVQIYVQMYEEFELSTGTTIERPWLHLQALAPDNDHIGLVMMKCRAICAIEEDLKQWLRRQGVPN